MNPLAVGSNVTLNLVPQSPINIGTWSYETTIIVLFYPNGSSVSTSYQGRVSFNRSSSELSISSLQLNDSGLYTVQGMEPVLCAVVTLSVRGKELTSPISNVTLRANATDLVELNDTAIFTCSVSSGTSLSYRWLNDSSEVTASDRVRLGGGNSTLTIVGVTRYDEGPFRCEVVNGINVSIRVLSILYINHTQQTWIVPSYKTGSVITLSCSAQSKPAVSYKWRFNETFLNEQSPQLSLQNTRQNQTGSYACVAHNNVTLRYATMTTIIKIVGEATFIVTKSVALNRDGKPLLLDQSFTLRCEVTGPVDYIHWLMNGQIISLNNRTFLSTDNKTMVINQIQLSDNGEYLCEINHTVLCLKVGPERPAVNSPDIALTGHIVTFNCSASSQPPSQFNWFFNGSQVATGSVYETGPLTLASHGEYTCVAFNNITGRNSTVSKMLTIIVNMAMVKVMGSQPIADYMFMMTCDTVGTIYFIHWMRNGWPLYAENRTDFSMNNNTLTFNSVQHSDNGDYQCSASNSLSNMTSPEYKLIVNYGPERPVIISPDIAMIRHIVTFNCSAFSQPPSQFSWFFNGSQVAAGSVYETDLLTLDSHGEYTCVAFNNITGRNRSVSKMLTIIGKTEESSKLWRLGQCMRLAH
uniref:Ig-like domain-containing protein n=1 Tax=Hucho hucho TaxID=62062 RepID=A0A4W5M142_9TELE